MPEPLDIGAALYALARFQLRTAAFTAGASEHIEDAYAFAWENQVYPLFHDGAQLHEPYAEYFLVKREPFRQLMLELDQAWLEDRVPSFYELEDQQDVRSGSSDWSRGALIAALRYAYLSHRFDARFYDAVRSPGRHPIEASAIDDDFDRNAEITLP